VYHICLLIIKVKPFGLKLLVKNILPNILQSACRKMPIFLPYILTYNRRLILLTKRGWKDLLNILSGLLFHRNG